MPTRSRRTILASLGALAATGAVGRSLATDGTDEDSNTVPTDGSTDWSTYRGNNKRTGATVESAAPNSEAVTTAWQTRQLAGYSDLPTEPIVANGQIYYTYSGNDPTGRRGKVVAFDAETGEENWLKVDGDEVTIGDAIVAPTVGDGRLYVGSSFPAGDGGPPGQNLFALDTETGDLVWERQDIGGKETFPLFADGTLFADGLALDAATGETLWGTSARTFVGLANGLLYGYEPDSRGIHPDSGKLVALNPDTGDVEQLVADDLPNALLLRSALTEDTMYWSNNRYDPDSPDESNPHEVVALSLADGSTRWRTRFESESEFRPYVSGLAVNNETVYVHASASTPGVLDVQDYDQDVQSTVYALHAASGGVKWTVDTSTVLLGDPTVAGDTVYVGGHARPKLEPYLNSEAPYVLLHYPTVHALSVDDGTESWSHLIRTPNSGDSNVHPAKTPIVSSGRVYLGTYDDLRTPDRSVRVTALEASQMATDSWNLPFGSDAPVARILVDPEGDDEPDRGPATRPENDAYEDFDGGTTVTLDGSVSAGDVETYEWRLGGSGSFDTTGRTTDVTLDFCGSLLVTLRVTGPDGEQSTASITLSTTE